MEKLALDKPYFLTGGAAGIARFRVGSRKAATEAHLVTLVRDDLSVGVA